MTDPAILWFRQDLRLGDNPVLAVAAERPVLPVFVFEDGPRAPGGAARWWLHHSLAALAGALAERGAPLVILRGDAREIIPRLAAEIGATEVHAGRQTEPLARSRDAATHAALEATGRRLVLHRNALLHEPHRVRTGEGRPYGVYTPFSRAVFALLEGLPPPLPAPGRLRPAAGAPSGLPLDGLGLLPAPPVPDWAAEFREHWTPGESGAHARLAAFLEHGLDRYAARRNMPGVAWGTSGLSPHLHLGEISPRQVWHAAREKGGAGLETFLKELLWREFSHHLLWHRPEMVDTPLRPEFAAFPWREDAALLRAWQRGRTGYPIVDAGMRELWRTGWMHNRVRMIAASFLVKHLLQPWQAGEAWFWDTLVDADLANNCASWQWVAGCGADAAPYFRIFNPVLQGEKFDPEGAYVRRWCPELARLPDRFIHRPHEAPEAVLREAGIVIGRDWPAPLVDLAEGRARALAAFAAIKGGEAA
ncbi:deoxyribodipyrimidine photo-lyase [Roseomonas alkaliterrae]|uniref:Deoxyribodipyrimidine photo-lyase n=1 Tax=Neoroseomonas alkaliterrae TaxID=1452450 RepID=A0A840XL25_9PROT|nr:deoxyribodipyrimidine photo-lyase [Neoroseomonas alkaliterrae]MBB5688616.1 deoxyribodipyrimidine photo-lyase [Neoroseomonas alkaliterrae]MBR0676860.1 deoxyribodipyrimidine photo-lyase [Neoroseomonas alkaliterrae]